MIFRRAQHAERVSKQLRQRRATDEAGDEQWKIVYKHNRRCFTGKARACKAKEHSEALRQSCSVGEVKNIPADDNQKQRQNMPHRCGDVLDLLFEQPLDTKKHVEIQAPEHKVPACTMPQSRQRPDDEQVQIYMPAVAAQRNVDVIAKEGAERDMPSAPELRDRARDIRQSEVLRVFEPENAAKADRHVGVAGKIEVDLKREQDHAQPHAKRCSGGELPVENLACDFARTVGQQHLFAQADAEARHAVENIFMAGRALFDLLFHVAVAHNRPGDELREQTHIQQKPPV